MKNNYQLSIFNYVKRWQMKIIASFIFAIAVIAVAFWASSGANAARTTGAVPALYGIKAIVMNPA
jgi:hypothetical protein